MKKDPSAEAVNQSKPGIIRKMHNSDRNAFSAKIASSRRSLLLPCALGLLMSAAMLACGSDDTQPKPGSDQPAAAAAVSQENTNATASMSGGKQLEQSDNNGRNAPAERTAHKRENDGASGEDNATTPPTATPVPTPTPDPRVSTMELLTKRDDVDKTFPQYPYVHEYNCRLITSALIEPLLDDFRDAMGELADYHTQGQLGVVIYGRLNQDWFELERIESDSPELHVKITIPFTLETRRSTDAKIEEVEYQITGNAVFELIPAEDLKNTQHASVLPSEATHLPSFSHFTSEPVMEKQ